MINRFLCGLVAAFLVIFGSAECKIGLGPKTGKEKRADVCLNEDLFFQSKLYGQERNLIKQDDPNLTIQYIQNYDGSLDYLYVFCEGGGYGFFFLETMEALELSPEGKNIWEGDPSSWCYGGPGEYLIKDGNSYFDLSHGFQFLVSDEDAFWVSESIRVALLSRAPNKKDPQGRFRNIAPSLAFPRNAPPIGTNFPIQPTIETLIPNYSFFNTNPIHGDNTNTNYCGAISAQSLLSYHNFFSERRLIKNNYLFGDPVYEPEKNPNYCSDPMSMTQYTTGTRSEPENGSDERNYFAYLKGLIPSNAFIGTAEFGIRTAIDTAGRPYHGFDYDLNYEVSNWWMGYPAIPLNEVYSEVDRGRPSIVLLQKSLGAINHYVVAYGYANYCYPNTQTTYSGLVTHFIEGNTQTNVWVNDLWICGYITLKFNHVHDYFEVGPIGNTGRTEWKCTECGHRTDCVLMVEASERHRELFLTISQNGASVREFYVIFENTKNRMFQTFGPNDMDLTLHSFDGQQLASGGDNGSFGVNAFFIYEVAAGVPYWLRINFHLWGDYGAAKIGITPVTVSYSTYNEILHLTGGGYNWNSNANTSRPVCFTPPSDGIYSVLVYYPGGAYNTYLQIIDPASLSPCWSAGDDSPSYQTSLTLNLLGGRRYLLLASLRNTSQYGFMGLSITNLSS